MADTSPPVDFHLAAKEADRAAYTAFSQGAYDRALTWLSAARQLDPGNVEVFAGHERRVIEAAEAQKKTPEAEAGS
jgi:hypothetical protein